VFYSDDPTSLYTYLAVGTWTTQTINVTVTRQWGQIDFNYNYDNNDVLPVRQTIGLAQS